MCSFFFISGPMEIRSWLHGLGVVCNNSPKPNLWPFIMLSELHTLTDTCETHDVVDGSCTHLGEFYTGDR